MRWDFFLLGLPHLLSSISHNVDQWPGTLAPIQHSHQSNLLKRQNSCSNGSLTTYFGQTFVVACGLEYSEVNQIAVQITFTPTYELCVLACIEFESTVDCISVQYSAGTPGPGGNLCYLLWSTDGPKDDQSPDVSIGVLQSNGSEAAMAAKCDSSSQAPFNYMSPFGGNYTVTCSHDYNHGDVYLTFAANILECCDHCSRYNLNATDNFCLGVSIDISTPGPSGAELSGFECWLKSNLSTLEAYQNSSSNSTGVTTTAIHAAMLNAPLPTPVTVQVAKAVLSGGDIAGIVLGTIGAFLGGIILGRWWGRQVIYPPPM